MNESKGKRIAREIVGYLSLIFAAVFFSGAFSSATNWTRIFDFQAIVGAYGENVVMTGGVGVKEGFMQSVSIAPVMIFSVAFIGCVQYLGGLRAAQKLLTPLLRPLMGVPGVCGLAMILNWQSSDASAAIARQLYESGQITSRERDRLVAYQFITAATIGVFFSNGAILMPYFACSTGIVLLVIMAMKFLAGNLMRLWQLITREKDERVEPSAQAEAAGSQQGAQEEKQGLINVFMSEAANGFTLWFKKLVPAVVFGYVVVRVLEITGLMQVIGKIFSPVMGLFGLPGEAAVPLIAGYMTLMAGCTSAAALAQSGVLTGVQVTILFPMLYCVASHLLYVGRVLGASGVAPKKYPVYLLIGLICAAVSGVIMNLIL